MSDPRSQRPTINYIIPRIKKVMEEAEASMGDPAKPLLRALKGEALEQPPWWLMRQAGRFLPEYRQLRAQARDFVDFCLTPALAAEATLQRCAASGWMRQSSSPIYCWCRRRWDRRSSLAKMGHCSKRLRPSGASPACDRWSWDASSRFMRRYGWCAPACRRRPR